MPTRPWLTRLALPHAPDEVLKPWIGAATVEERVDLDVGHPDGAIFQPAFPPLERGVGFERAQYGRHIDGRNVSLLRELHEFLEDSPGLLALSREGVGVPQPAEAPRAVSVPAGPLEEAPLAPCRRPRSAG